MASASGDHVVPVPAETKGSPEAAPEAEAEAEKLENRAAAVRSSRKRTKTGCLSTKALSVSGPGDFCALHSALDGDDRC